MGNCFQRQSAASTAVNIPSEHDTTLNQPLCGTSGPIKPMTDTVSSKVSTVTASVSISTTNNNKDIIHGAFKDCEKKAVESILENNPTIKFMMIEFNQLKLLNEIGSGAFGEVIKGKYRGAPVVVKRIKRHNINERHLRMFVDEISLMTTLRHPNIVQFIGASWDSYSNVCMVTEFVDRGDLYSVLRSTKISLSWQQHLLEMLLDTARGMYYLHGMTSPIIHRDLKSMNILVTKTFNCKITDFGVSREKSIDETMTMTGTPLWLSPEIIRGESYCEKVDVYSFGIVIAELESRKLPYHDAKRIVNGVEKKISPFMLQQKIAFEDLRPQLSATTYKGLRNLFLKCVDRDPAVRPSFEEIVTALDEPIRDEIMSKEDVILPAPASNTADPAPAVKYVGTGTQSQITAA